MPTTSVTALIKVQFDALPSDAVQGVIPIPGLKAGDILLGLTPLNGPNSGVQWFFENIISNDDELMQTGGSWEGATPTMVGVFFRG